MPASSRPYKAPNVEFLLSAPDLSHCPDLGTRPEIAMLGRSNVGKSSFINRLVRRKRLAHTSNTPGKTRLINTYLVDDSWALVDLPGYGFAKVSKTEQQRWKVSLEEYLVKRETLLGVLQLIDSRHGPQPNDQTMNAWLESHGLEVAAVLTKTDKTKKSELAKAEAAARRMLYAPRGVFRFSAETGEGSEALWWALEEWRRGASDGA